MIDNDEHTHPQVREELISLTPNNTTLVEEVNGALGQERLTEMLEDKKLNARQVQVMLPFSLFVFVF